MILYYLKANKFSFNELKLSPENLAEMINMISENTISEIAKEILPELIKNNISPKKLVQEKGLAMILILQVFCQLMNLLLNIQTKSKHLEMVKLNYSVFCWSTYEKKL